MYDHAYCICLISYKPYVMVVSSVFTWNIPQFATLSLSSLSLARSRQRLARLVAVTISADSCLSTTGTRHPVIRPRHLHPTSTGILHLHTGTLNKWYSSIQIDMILLFVQCENVPTGVVCMYQHCTYYLYLLFKIKYDENDDDIH